MTSVTIQLTDEMRRFLDAMLLEGVRSGPDEDMDFEAMEAEIRAEARQLRLARQHRGLVEIAMLEARPETLEAMLLEGLDSGPPGEWDFEKLRAAVRQEDARLRELKGSA